MKTILIVDDEPRMLDLISLYLTPVGYKCIKMNQPKEALRYLSQNKVDLVLLDIMMPEMDGWETCVEIKKIVEVPIIMITARTDKSDVVKGLSIGADDYISKPFDEEELLARINAVLRRNNNTSDKIIFKGLELNPESYELRHNRNLISLTPKEFSLLSLFLTNRNKVFTRDHLITTIWGHGVNTDDRTIDSHVRNIRDKLRTSTFPVDDHLSTVWGVGYKWSD